jgi:hypothetical protein
VVRQVFSDVLLFRVSVRCVALNDIEVRSDSSVYDSIRNAAVSSDISSIFFERVIVRETRLLQTLLVRMLGEIPFGWAGGARRN